MNLKNKNTLSKGEWNDCTVRAMVHVSGLQYDDAHKWIADNMTRKPRRGPSYVNAVDAMDNAGSINGNKVTRLEKECLKTVYGSKERKMTLKTFIKNNPKGNFYILVRAHALAIVNGEVMDNTSERCRILEAWELNDK